MGTETKSGRPVKIVENFTFGGTNLVVAADGTARGFYLSAGRPGPAVSAIPLNGGELVVDGGYLYATGDYRVTSR